MKSIFGSFKHPNPNCTLCHLNDRDTWPHLLSTCEHPYLKGLRIARHNKAVHLITHALQANINTRFFTLTNACNLNNKPPEQTIPNWLIKCTWSHKTCTFLARLRPDILCILGASNNTQTSITPSPTLTTQLIEFTYCHDRYPDQALTHKHTNYDPLVNAIHTNGWANQPTNHHHIRSKRGHTRTFH